MKKEYKKWIWGSAVAGASYLFLEAVLFEKYFFQIKSFTIGNKEGGTRIKILLLTDLHFKKSVWPYDRRLARIVNDIQPDLIFITGDVLDRTGEMCPVERFFSLLDPHLLKVAIPGNHDHKADPDLPALEKVYQKYNCEFLVNKSKAFEIKGKKLVVSGLDDFIEGESHFEEAVKDIGKEDHHFLLIHSPLQQEKVKKKLQEINSQRREEEQLNIGYIFAGHNHGGQVRLPGFVPVLPKKSGDYVNGWYNSEKPCLYVSKGFGTSTVPFRFGARAEVSLFNYFA